MLSRNNNQNNQNYDQHHHQQYDISSSRVANTTTTATTTAVSTMMTTTTSLMTTTAARGPNRRSLHNITDTQQQQHPPKRQQQHPKRQQQQQPQQVLHVYRRTAQEVQQHKLRMDREEQVTRQLLAQANQLLQDVDESDFMTKMMPSSSSTSSTTRRHYPRFAPKEVVYGPLLGVGGFGIVFEIQKFKLLPSTNPPPATAALPGATATGLDSSNSNSNHHKEKKENQEAFPANTTRAKDATTTTTITTTREVDAVKELDSTTTTATTTTSSSTTAKTTDTSTPTTAVQHNNNKPKTTTISFQDDPCHAGRCKPQEQEQPPKSVPLQEQHPDNAKHGDDMQDEDEEEDAEHYNIDTARQFMADHAQRNGTYARYAVKRLHRDLSNLERARGMIDLAVEAKFLSVLCHPNIVKMRGMAALPYLDPKFFIILDRLHTMLPEKMNDWKRAVRQANKTKVIGTGGGSSGGLWSILISLRGGGNSYQNNPALQQLMVERMTVAYDLAAAFWYMHERNLVYRDIKQENIGFDVRGDVKVFDFGLCKSLSPKLKYKDAATGRDGYGYNLTPRTGSVPYMAPEVVLSKPYDCKCDVFSFSILLWELLSLKVAFQGYTRKNFYDRVVQRNERLPVCRHWPSLTKLIMTEAWMRDPEKRPTMKRVAVLLRGDLNGMTTDTRILERTSHMRERSEHSLRLSGRHPANQKVVLASS